QKILFFTLAGTEDVQLDGHSIVGRFKPDLRKYDGPSLIQDFVNWRNEPVSWVRFVRRYGPLLTEARHGLTFQSDVKEFTENQERFRQSWLDKRSGWQLSCKITITCLARKTTFRVEDLRWFLFLDLVTQDPKRLKLCRNPTCPTPYFIAHHLGQ